MLRRVVFSAVILLAALAAMEYRSAPAEASGRGQPTSWSRFFHYPYVYYPHNFRRQRGSYNHLYYRYPQEMRIPVYNKNWYNFYPQARTYHRGHHFVLDVF